MPFPIGVVSPPGDPFPLVVAVGESGRIATSGDGTTWTERRSEATVINAYSDVVWAADLGLWVAVGQQVVSAANEGLIATSPNGIVWDDVAPASISSNPTEFGRGIAYSPDLSLFVAIPTLKSTDDGATWVDESTGNANIGITWAAGLSKFIAVGFSSGSTAGVIAHSADGDTWTVLGTVPMSFGASAVQDVCWSDDLTLAVAVGNDGKIATSADALTFTQRTSGTSTILFGVAWSPSLGLFAAVGGTVILTSPDGTTWTSRTSPFTASARDVCWSADLGLFVAVGTDGEIATSPNGTSWTARTSPFGTDDIRGVYAGSSDAA